jgi:long-subunit acyl-CoA synthetase (AMP-forming)
MAKSIVVTVLYIAYGLTETSTMVTIVPDRLDPDFSKSKSGSVGVPLHNVQIKVSLVVTEA